MSVIWRGCIFSQPHGRPAASSPFVPDPAQEFPPFLPVFVRLLPFWREAVDHTDDAPALGGGGDQYLERIGRRAVDAADLGALASILSFPFD